MFSPEQFNVQAETTELSMVLWPQCIIKPKGVFLIQILTAEMGSSFSLFYQGKKIKKPLV